MAEQEERSGIFPLVDRRTPILDRIRNGRGSSDVGTKLGNEIGNAVISDDEEQVKKGARQLEKSIRQGIAESLGVDVTDVSETIPKAIRKLIQDADEEDVLTEEALADLGLADASLDDILEEEEEEEDEEDDEDSDFF